MRLIDADAFRREIDNHWPFTKEEQSKHGIADMAKGTLLYVLNCMPTIEPERKKGKWIPQDHNKHHGMISTTVYYFPRCSVCGESANYTNFCPNCGSDNREDQHD